MFPVLRNVPAVRKNVRDAYGEGCVYTRESTRSQLGMLLMFAAIFFLH